MFLFPKDTPRLPLTGYSAHHNAIFNMSWCPVNQNRLVTVSGDKSVVLWDTSGSDLKR